MGGAESRRRGDRSHEDGLAITENLQSDADLGRRKRRDRDHAGLALHEPVHLQLREASRKGRLVTVRCFASRCGEPLAVVDTIEATKERPQIEPEAGDCLSTVVGTPDLLARPDEDVEQPATGLRATVVPHAGRLTQRLEQLGDAIGQFRQPRGSRVAAGTRGAAVGGGDVGEKTVERERAGVSWHGGNFPVRRAAEHRKSCDELAGATAKPLHSSGSVEEGLVPVTVP